MAVPMNMIVDHMSVVACRVRHWEGIRKHSCNMAAVPKIQRQVAKMANQLMMRIWAIMLARARGTRRMRANWMTVISTPKCFRMSWKRRAGSRWGMGVGHGDPGMGYGIEGPA